MSRRTTIMSSRIRLRSLLGGAVISLFFIAAWSTTASRLSSLTTTGSAGKAGLAAHKPTKPVGAKIRSALVQSAPTVVTNYIDYQPGDTVVITGTGWLPGETVALTIVETDGDVPWLSQAPADSSGNIYNNQFVIQSHDHGVTFTLTANGQTSGLTATATFTDNVVVDFQQSANNETTGTVTGLGNIHWINSIVQSSNSRYFEGMSNLQRSVFTGVAATPSDIHRLTFSH